MKFNAIVLMVFIAGFQLLTGCQRILLFQPPPPMFETWTKQGANESDVKRAMLACGYKDPFGFYHVDSVNELVLSEKCMFKQGYKYKTGSKGYCSIEGYGDVPACRDTQ